MTDQAPDQKRPDTTEKAAEIVREDPALKKATEKNADDSPDQDQRSPVSRS